MSDVGGAGGPDETREYGPRSNSTDWSSCLPFLFIWVPIFLCVGGAIYICLK
jgi:hypothetical protein